MLIDPHADRLIRDLRVMGAMQAGNLLSADERLAAELGPDLLDAVRAELDHQESETLPLPGRRLRVVA